jgi:predicted anti-sigma-YlaC factor YlaD
MLTPVPPSACTTAREAASALLDGELSELEAAQLDAHLRGCRACSAWADELAGLAARLRLEPLEPLELPVFTARSRRPALRLPAVAAAVTILVATASSFAIGQVVGSHGGAPTATVGTTIAARTQPANEVLGMLRRLRPGRLESGRVIPV